MDFLWISRVCSTCLFYDFLVSFFDLQFSLGFRTLSLLVLLEVGLFWTPRDVFWRTLVTKNNLMVLFSIFFERSFHVYLFFFFNDFLWISYVNHLRFRLSMFFSQCFLCWFSIAFVLRQFSSIF